MALFATALAWTLNFEDPEHAYATVPDAPPGASAIAGINSAAWPEEFAAIDALMIPERPAAVESFYQTHFWNQWLEQLTSDEVAKRVFDAGVNMGQGMAVKLLQGAVNASGGSVAVDGQFGPKTLACANSCDVAVLVAQFQTLRAAHYENIASADPQDQKYLATWLARAQA